MASDNVFSFAIATASPKGGTLEQMLANTTNCYKYVWMLALLRIASENKREFVSFKEMTARMVAAAWYPVIYFRLNLGYSDQLAELIYAVSAICRMIRRTTISWPRLWGSRIRMWRKRSG